MPRNIAIQSCAVLTGAVLLIGCHRPAPKTTDSSEEMPSFQEVLKNGDKRDQAYEMMNPQLPAHLSDAELESIVQGYVNSQGQSRDYWKIVELLQTSRDRLTPLFLKVALAPGSEIRPAEHANDVLYDTPLERALTYLDEGKHPELVPRLLPLSASSDRLIRGDVATHLAAFGSDDVIAATVSLLADPKSSEASSAMSGISEALKAGRATPAYRAALFDPVTVIVRQGAIFGNVEGTLLLNLDPERARPILLEQISKDTIPACHALEALNRARIPVAPETLLGILEANRNPGEKELWRISFYGSALLALARQKHPEARLEIDRALTEKPSNLKGVPSYKNIALGKQEEACRALMAWENFQPPTSGIATKNWEDPASPKSKGT